MKKILIAAALATPLFSAPAMAAVAANTSTTVGGTIALDCSIDGSTDLSTGLSLTPGQITPLSDVKIKCNSAGGFTATAKSTNAGKLVNRSSSGSSYAYELQATIDGGTGLYSLAQDLPYTPTDHATAITTKLVPVGIKVGALTGPAYAGTYVDTITWTIQAN